MRYVEQTDPYIQDLESQILDLQAEMIEIKQQLIYAESDDAKESLKAELEAVKDDIEGLKQDKESYQQAQEESTILNKKYVEKTNKTYDYHSTQIDLDSDKDLLDFANSIVLDKFIYNDENDEYGREDEPHITVLYGLIDKVKPSEVQDIIYGEEFECFPIRFGGITSFRIDDKPYDVLKIDVISEHLEKLHYLLRDRLPNENTFPEYCPHFTIAYVKKGTCKDIEEEYTHLTDREVMVEQIKFSHINGDKIPIYLY